MSNWLGYWIIVSKSVLDPLGEVKEGEKEGERVKDKEGERQRGREGKRKREGERVGERVSKQSTDKSNLPTNSHNSIKCMGWPKSPIIFPVHYIFRCQVLRIKTWTLDIEKIWTQTDLNQNQALMWVECKVAKKVCKDIYQISKVRFWELNSQIGLGRHNQLWWQEGYQEHPVSHQTKRQL